MRNPTPDTCLISKPHNKTLLLLPGEIPPLQRSLSRRRGATEACGPRDTGAFRRRRGGSCPVLSRRHGCTGGFRGRLARGGRGGVRSSARRQMLRAGVLPLARTCLYQGVPERAEAELSRRSRGGCGAWTAVPRLSPCRGRQGSSVPPRGRRRAVAGVRRPSSALGTQRVERSGLRLLALGAKAGAIRGHVRGGARGPCSGRSRVSSRSASLSSGASDAQPGGSTCLPHTHYPSRLPQRKRSLSCASASDRFGI